MAMPLRGLLAGAGLLAALASVWLAATGDLEGHPLGAAVAAAMATALWTPAIICAWPRTTATLTSALVAGLLGLAADSTLAVWTIPQRPADLGVLTSWAAGSATAIYLVAFLAVLASRGRPLSFPASWALLALPFLFNLLLALGSRDLMAWLGGHIGAASSVAPWLGRGLTLWLFNVLVVAGVAWVLDHRGMPSWRIHAVLLLAALAALVTPVVAHYPGSLPAGDGPGALRLIAVVLSGALAQAGLWAEVFLLTGVLLDGLRGARPTSRSCIRHWRSALLRGAIFGGLYTLLTHGAVAAAQWSGLTRLLDEHLLLGGAVIGAVLFPLARTLLESFDGSDPFLARLVRAYADPVNGLRGLCAGSLLALALSHGMPGWSQGDRFLAGFGIGALAYAAVDMLRDLYGVLGGIRQRLQAPRVYVLGLLLGGVVGGALAWYFDAAQLAVVTAKFRQYAELGGQVAGQQAGSYVVYPLFSKWGAIDLGPVNGGVRLLWAESMAGVINWAIAAPLFGFNFVVLAALFERSFAPLRELFSAAGLVRLFGQTIRVLRWGPWMAPIIFTFLRLSPEPTWYNQDGLVRSLVVLWQSAGVSPEAFRLWSLQCFLGLLAYDWLRVLIWFDHMGLRVATLVNLSFVGGDVLDEKAARFLGHSARSRVIPEGIRRFFTWAPLLLPFYLPRGEDWDYVWNGSEALRREPATPLLPAVDVLVLGYAIAGVAIAILVAGLLAIRQRLGLHSAPRNPPAFAYRLGNGQYGVELNPDGGGYSHVESALRPGFEIDLTRRPDGPSELRGKWFWLREMVEGAPVGQPWSLTARPSGHPDVRYSATQPRPTLVRYVAEHGDLRVEAEIEVVAGRTLETWTVRLLNDGDRPRAFELTSYRELAIAPTDSYRRAPPFAAMHVGTCFLRELGAVVARNRRLRDRRGRSSPEVAFHAVDAGQDGVQLLGYEDSRPGFLGTGTLGHAAAFAGRALRSPEDEGHLYSFDPVACLRVKVLVPAHGSAQVRFVEGYAEDARAGTRLIAQAFGRRSPDAALLNACLARHRRLRHSDVRAAAADAFSADGTEVRAPSDAERPWTHVLANELGFGAIVSADGGVYCFHRNAQQNALTPFAIEELPTQRPGQLLALVDLDTRERFNASLIPWRCPQASRRVTFGLGYARFRAQWAGLELEETLVVPPDAPLLVRELRVRNVGPQTRRLRAVAVAEIVLGETPVDTLGRVEAQVEANGALLFRNESNDFCKGWAFAATSLHEPIRETQRARFLGDAREMADAYFLAHGRGDAHRADDGARCAAFAGVLELRPGEEQRASLIIGHAANRGSALELARRICNTDAGSVSRTTRAWWLDQLGTLQVETDRPEFDRLVNTWLPYQVRVARLWGRCGPQQRGGAFGFRDQLQDVLPLAWTHPAVARSQILLHAAQQFREGDVLAWWHPSWEGLTGIGARTAASDSHLWLPYVVAHYVRASGDRSVLQETVHYLEGRRVPARKQGILFAPRRSEDRDSVYEHCRRAIEHALARLSPRGLPLIGSGDWNDGFDMLGLRGRGESVWLGFLLHDTLRSFVPLAAGQGDALVAQRYDRAAGRLRAALELAWRDDGYARATGDTGHELRFASALMAAWPVLSGAVPEDRGKMLLESALRVLEKETRVLLLSPPFGESARPYPGSIALYPPGVRENGGQYSHGASWVVDAWLRLAKQAASRGDHAQAGRCHGRAWEIWWKISPLSKTEPLYGLPPHQQPADVYDGPGYAGRGGWAWYTGAAARMLQAAYGLLGLDMRDGELRVNTLAHGTGAPRLRRLRFRGREM